MCAGGDACTRTVLNEIALDEITRPDDSRLVALSALLERTFADPNSVLGLERIQQFLGDNSATSSRWFHALVAENDQKAVVGGSIFSYVPNTACGFSEYLVLEPESRGTGLGRKLFERRKAILNARANGHCHGLFIEVDSPERTPPEMLEAERSSSMEEYARLRLFAHFGFKRVDIAYVQPPLGPGKQAVDYLDLLFAPWESDPDVVPVEWILKTLAPIWSAWAPEHSASHLEQLRESLGSVPVVSLEPLSGGAAE
jgi:GNAT superfamily N-acetyltransferase